MVDYIKGRLNIDDMTFQAINWVFVGKVRTFHSIGQKVQTRKMMYRWLPVGHNWIKCNLNMDRYPCCRAKDETFEHLLSYIHDNSTSYGKQHTSRYKKTCDEAKLPSNFTRVFRQVICSILAAEEISAPLDIPEAMSGVIVAQRHIGQYNMVIGFVSKE